MSYVFNNDELQGHLNTAFVNAITSLSKEKYLTQKQCDEICSNYSIIIESNTWLPKALSKWLGLADNRIHYRLAKVINRRKGSSEADDETT